MARPFQLYDYLIYQFVRVPGFPDLTTRPYLLPTVDGIWGIGNGIQWKTTLLHSVLNSVSAPTFYNSVMYQGSKGEIHYLYCGLNGPLWVDSETRQTLRTFFPQKNEFWVSHAALTDVPNTDHS